MATTYQSVTPGYYLEAGETVVLSVCDFCLVFVANGDLPEDEGHADLIVGGVERWALDGYTVVAGDADNGFSRYPCEVCAVPVAGDRYGAVAIAR